MIVLKETVMKKQIKTLLSTLLVLVVLITCVTVTPITASAKNTPKLAKKSITITQGKQYKNTLKNGKITASAVSTPKVELQDVTFENIVISYTKNGKSDNVVCRVSVIDSNLESARKDMEVYAKKY